MSDANGTPTPLGIPTFDVDHDPPTGAGSNTQMSSIDTLISQRVKVVGTPTDGQAVVWNASLSQWQPATLNPTNPAGAAALGTFTGKNVGSLTAFVLNAISFDNIGSILSISNPYQTISIGGVYLVSAWGQLSGQSGSGGGQLQIERQNSSGVQQEIIGKIDFPFVNAAGTTGAGIATFSATDRIVISQSNGATGTAGTMAGRLHVVRLT